MLTSEKSVNQSVGRRRFSETKVIAYVLRRDPLSMFGLAFITILVFTAIFAPIIAPYKSDVWGTPRPGYKFLPPSLTHLFGTDYFGRDVFSLVLMGARASLMAGLVVVTLSLLIGCPLGVIAGYFRGTMTDEIIMRITDMFLALPPLLLAIAVAATLGY